MGKFHVNIYIETSIKGPAPREAAGKWLAEFVKSTGDSAKREGILWKEAATENTLTLELFCCALDSLAKPCSIRVYTQCVYVRSAINNHWVSQWAKNGWLNAKGGPVRNMGLWQQAYERMGKHSIGAVTGKHFYQQDMQDDIRKELNIHHGR